MSSKHRFRRRYDRVEYRFENDRMIAWLRTQSPDMWHRIVDVLNWGYATRTLLWVVKNPNCDKATVQMLLLNNGACWISAEEISNEDLDYGFDDGAAVAVTMIRNWNAGRYKRSEIQSYDGFGEAFKSWAKSMDEEGRDAIDRSIGEELHGRVIPPFGLGDLTYEIRAMFDDLGSQWWFQSEEDKQRYDAWHHEIWLPRRRRQRIARR